MVREEIGFFPGDGLEFRGYDSAIGPNGEKSVPARRTSIGGKTQQAKQPRECSSAMLAGYPREVHVAAHIAMHIMHVRDGNGPCIKSSIAAAAAPGAQKCDANYIILHTFAAGTARAVRMADRTNQFLASPGKLWRAYARDRGDGKFACAYLSTACKM